MSSAAFDIAPLAAKIVVAVAAAAMVGGGTVVLSTAQTVAVHEQQISTLLETSKDIKELRETLHETNENVAVLNERLSKQVTNDPSNGRRAR